MSGRTWTLLGFVILFAAALVVHATPASPQGEVRYVPAERITNPDGAAVYNDYCSVCHGPTGKGDGRAARYLKTPIPDLTLIALRDGTFDANRVVTHIDHVDRTSGDPMPCWGRVLGTQGDNPGTRTLVLWNLARHIETLQARR